MSTQGGATARSQACQHHLAASPSSPAPPARAQVSAAIRRARATLPLQPAEAKGTGLKPPREQPVPLASPRVIRPACFPGLLAPPLRRRIAALQVRPFSRFEFSLAKRKKQNTRMAN
ncbi:hypothetical protein NN561_005822 [Cricetulus griseus]